MALFGYFLTITPSAILNPKTMSISPVFNFRRSHHRPEQRETDLDIWRYHQLTSWCKAISRGMPTPRCLCKCRVPVHSRLQCDDVESFGRSPSAIAVPQTIELRGHRGKAKCRTFLPHQSAICEILVRQEKAPLVALLSAS
jgi:hypothetical protein